MYLVRTLIVSFWLIPLVLRGKGYWNMSRIKIKVKIKVRDVPLRLS